MASDGILSWCTNKINSNKVMVFSKTHCPFCIKAIKCLNTLKPDGMHIEQIESNPECKNIQAALLSITKSKTVPQVFIGGTYFGGGSETEAALNSGVLKQKLNDAGAL